MYIEHLQVRDIRIIQDAELTPARGMNLLSGPNGSGKTSLLEAISILGSGHAFTTHQVLDVIRKDRDSLSVVGRLRYSDGRQAVLGLEKARDLTRIKLNGEAVQRASSVMQQIPVLVIGPRSQALLAGGPKERRNLLDRTMFHVEQTYLEGWRRYHAAMQSRNALLRDGAPGRDFEYWHAELARLGEKIDTARRDCVEQLRSSLERLPAAAFTGKISIQYRPGWPKGKSLHEALGAALPVDRQTGGTSVGPHRAELQIRVNDYLADTVTSRGQAKIIVGSLVISQAEVIRSRAGISPIVLIDDLGAELGPEARILLLEMLENLAGQSFVTVVEAIQIPDKFANEAMFHVKQGVITARQRLHLATGERKRVIE